jgi:VanZ family protein
MLRHRKLIWLITLVWAATIFNFSTEPFGAGVSENLVVQTLTSVGVSASPRTVDRLNSLGRTLAHLTEYAIFGLLLYGSFWRPDECLWRPDLAFRAVAIAAAYGLTDEFHQRFVPGRGPSLFDSSLDALGAALAMGLLYGLYRWLGRNSNGID